MAFHWKHWVIILGLLVLLSLGVVSLMENSLSHFFVQSKELSSPGDWVHENQIEVYPDQVVLKIPSAAWAGFTNTNSMDPFIDEKANAIEIKPAHPQAIQVGDVISYKTPYGVIIHRVIEVQEDQQGVYYLVKGDNSTFQDPLKIRFNDVQGVVVAVIY